MKKFLVQVVLLIIVIAFGLFFYVENQNGKRTELPFVPQVPTFATLQINGANLKVELADTASKRSKGLSGKDSLAADEGMLFIFEKADKHPFWMKGLKFPLDFVWIKDNKVMDILENVPQPAPGANDASLPVYSSKVEVDKVLEVNSGVVQRLNIKIGDTITLR